MSEAEHSHDWIRQAMVGDKKSLDPAYCRTCPAIRRGGQVVMPDNQSALQATIARAEAAEAERDDFERCSDDYAHEIDALTMQLATAKAALDEAKKWLQKIADSPSVLTAPGVAREGLMRIEQTQEGQP